MLFLFVPRDSIGNHSDEAGSGAVAKTHRRESPQERTLAKLVHVSDVPRSGGYPGSSSPVVPSLFAPLPPPLSPFARARPD